MESFMVGKKLWRGALRHQICHIVPSLHLRRRDILFHRMSHFSIRQTSALPLYLVLGVLPRYVHMQGSNPKASAT